MKSQLTMNFAVNIGTEDCFKAKVKKDFQLWWEYCLKNNIITGGFDGELGDEGTSIFRDTISKGSWIFAYVNGHGFVGVGIAESRNTYRCFENSDMAEDYMTCHLHHRSVKWMFFVDSLAHAVPCADVDNFYPRSTLRFTPKAIADVILKKLLAKDKVKITLPQ
jgi:hypothetical protein